MTLHGTCTFDAEVTRLRARLDEALASFLDRDRQAADGAELHAALQLLRWYVLGGGKRLRPTFCYWGWRGAGGPDCDEIVRAAAALELFHAFALIHDDIMDGSPTRRGRPAMHCGLATLHTEAGWRGDPREFGVAGAILLGDLCMAWADELLHGCGLDPARLVAAQPIYDRMREDVCWGQYLDIAETARGPLSVDRSLNVVRYKAAKYTVEHPLQLGGALAGATEAVMESYTAFGLPLGEAFQLRDDVIGVFGDPAVTGKSTLDDLREGKPTVLMAYAVQHGTAEQRATIRRLHGDPELDEEGAAQLRALLRDSGALAAVERMIESRTDQALAALGSAPLPDDARQALADLAVAATRRDR